MTEGATVTDPQLVIQFQEADGKLRLKFSRAIEDMTLSAQGAFALGRDLMRSALNMAGGDLGFLQQMGVNMLPVGNLEPRPAAPVLPTPCETCGGALHPDEVGVLAQDDHVRFVAFAADAEEPFLTYDLTPDEAEDFASKVLALAKRARAMQQPVSHARH